MRFIDKIAKDFAPGIPDKDRYKSIPENREYETWKINLQKHKAKKSGLHWDLRLNPPGSSDAYSWAIRNWPGPGDKSLAVEQPTHKEHYMGFEGEIEEGYGAGSVTSELLDNAEVLESNPGKILFNIYQGRDATRYMLKRLGGKDWILYNYTPTEKSKDIPNYKPKTKDIPFKVLRTDLENEVFAPKLDGAHNIVQMRPDKRIDVFSYRTSKRSPKKIDQSYRTDLYKIRSPKELGDTMVRSELYIPGKPGNEVARILNSNVWKARQIKQKEHDTFKSALIDIIKFKGQNVEDRPYREKLKMLKEVQRYVPQLEMPSLYSTPKEKKNLVKAVTSGRHPDTEEGVIIYKLDEPAAYKSKKRKDWDVLKTGEFPATRGSKYSGSHIGGFVGRVESEDGPKIKIGTGLDDQTRRDAYLNPKDYIGEWAKVEGQRRTTSGKIYAPSYKGLRAEKYPNVNIKQRARQADIEDLFKLSEFIKFGGAGIVLLTMEEKERKKKIKSLYKLWKQRLELEKKSSLFTDVFNKMSIRKREKIMKRFWDEYFSNNTNYKKS